MKLPGKKKKSGKPDLSDVLVTVGILTGLAALIYKTLIQKPKGE